MVNQLTLHLATYFWQLDGSWTPRLLIAGVFGTIVAMFLAPAWMRLVGSRAAMISGSRLLRGSGWRDAAAAARPRAAARRRRRSARSSCAFRVLGGLAYGLYVVPFNAVTYDIGDEHEANTGKPQQGLVASFMFIGLQARQRAGRAARGLVPGLIDFPVGLPVDQMPTDKVARWRGSSSR